MHINGLVCILQCLMQNWYLVFFLNSRSVNYRSICIAIHRIHVWDEDFPNTDVDLHRLRSCGISVF